MASWDSYTKKTTPADNDTLMIKDTAGGANKRTPFSGVWNWIVKKLASAVISQLETTNKSIIPAINELNSKSKNIYGHDRINNDINVIDILKTYETVGIHLVTTSSRATSLPGNINASSLIISFVMAPASDIIMLCLRLDDLYIGRISSGEFGGWNKLQR